MIRSLKVGCKGLDVKAVQDALNYRRKPGDEFLVLDGDFGTHTRAAVVRFQADHGLDPDGVVGHWTRQALFPLMTFSCYLGVSRSGQDYPVATRAFNRGSAFGDAKAKGSTEGDLPEPVPVPNQILPNLKFPNDPADGPMKTLGLGGFSLPAPVVARIDLRPSTGLRSSAGRWPVRDAAPLAECPGSSNPSFAAVLALQQVYARNKSQDGHAEIALGIQVLAPIWANTKDGLAWGIQPFIQFTWADPFWRRGKFHLVAPFAQVTAQTDFMLNNPVFGIGLFPVNISFDVSETISIIGQGGIVGTWDVNNSAVRSGPSLRSSGAGLSRSRDSSVRALESKN